MSKENMVRLGPDRVSAWPKSKMQPEYFLSRIEWIDRYVDELISEPAKDHPTRVYIKNPSKRLLEALAPHLALQRVDPSGETGRATWWKVLLSDKTANVDPVDARRINNFIAASLQEMFWIKDGRAFVESAYDENSGSGVVLPFDHAARQKNPNR